MNKCVSVLLKTKSSEKINVEFVPTTVQNCHHCVWMNKNKTV